MDNPGWAKGIPLETLLRGIEHPICFGGFLGATQVAFARVISDCATFADLVDVFVLPAYRGLGYGKALITAIVEHPQLQGLRRFTLATADAHGLYAQFGFTSPLRPQSLMERYFPNIYVDVDRRRQVKNLSVRAQARRERSSSPARL